MNKRKQTIVAGLICGALSIGMVSSVVYAADTEEFTLDEYVVTANRMKVKENEVASDVTVINQETLAKGNYSTISDALRDSNINVSVTGFAAYPVINGDSRVVVLVNGRKMNWSHLTVSGADNATNIDGFPVKNVERIEIVRGPNTALYGSDAVAGVINIITKKPEEGQSTTVTTEAGSWGAWRTAMTTEGGDKDLRYSFTYDKQKRDNYDYKTSSGKKQEFPDSSYDKEYESLRLDKSMGKDTLSFELERSHQDNGFGNYLTDPEAGTVYGSGMKINTTDLNMALTYAWANMDAATAGDYVRVYRNNQKDDSPFAGTPYEHDLTNWGLQTQKTWQLNENNSLVGGVEYLNEKINEENDGVGFNRSANSKSLYAEDHWKFEDGWSMNLGSRYENHSDFGGDVTSHISFNKAISDRTNAYLSWGQAVNNPTLKQRYANSPYWLGNPSLKQEKSNTVTLGVNSQLDEKTNLQASIYQSKVNNALDWIWDTSISKTVYYNVNSEKRRGLEVNATRKLSDQWSVNTGYSYSKIEKTDKTTGFYSDYIYNSRPNGYQLGVSYKQDKWDGRLTAQQVTGRSTTAYTDKSYVTLDLNLNYHFNQDLKAYIKGYNLTDEGYEILSSSVGKGAYAMPGRYFMFGVEAKL
ncbi:MAG: cirA 5 [Firmicutes bacterium]|nr:cirA 5 [Bacillota bacterium]